MKKQIMAAMAGLMVLAMSGCALSAQAKALEPAEASVSYDTVTPPADHGTGEKEMTVTAAGQGMIYDTPDRAEISFSIQTEDASASTAQEKNSETVAAVMEVLTERGVEEKNIKTRGYDLYPTYDYSGKNPRLTGYVVTTRISVTDRTIEETGELLGAIVAAGANGIDSVSYSCSNYDSDYEQALAKAVQAARRKAEVMAEALGMELGDVKLVTEGYQDMTYRNDSLTRSYAKEMFAEEAAADSINSVAVMPGEAQISATVTAVYYLK